ncbi:hypothetical protein RhiirA4_486809 [Rhizophagus irregularis]|uniref:Uncharacterized protein n=1 Tax=Rhizophagus irregularis TaxID=588596 RepID=A0A2I1HS20_9GLOM|nr:hypothetical protein RhiirA4_486809 [Rhizophagus irregularis]
MEYITLTRKEGEEKYPSRKVRVKNREKIKEKSEGLLDTVIISIRYRNKPDYMKMGIKSIIKVISEHYMFDEEDNLLIDNKVEENLLGNRELLTYGYIIEDDELDIRFLRFEEWLEESELTTIKDKKYINMRYFKEILHLEENIIKEENRDKVREFQKKIDYQWSNNYVKPWKNDDLTDKIIGKLFETKGFNKEYDNVEELVSSNEEDDVSENIRTEAIEYDKEFYEKICKSCFEKRKENNEIIEREKATIIAEKWIERGHVNITIRGIMRLLKLGYDELRLENDREFIDKYIEYNDLLDDELIIKLNELDNETETKKRLERLKNLIEVLEIEVSDGELLRLISMEYRDVDILSADFIKLFQEYKNESEKEIKRILDEYLKKFEIEESEEEVEEENDDTDDSEKIGEILDPEEHEIWEENIEDFNENEFENNNENVINTEGFGLSQNSDSNNSLNIKDSDNESELSDYNLQDLFQENTLLNMGATRAEVREDFRAGLLAATGHDIGGNWAGLIPANLLANAIEDAGNIAGGIVNIPLFYGNIYSDWESTRG